jgi:hypothetical protein
MFGMKPRTPFEKDWRQREKAQFNNAKKASFFPIPTETLNQSDSLFDNPLNLTSSMANWRSMILPIKPMYYTSLALDVTSDMGNYPPNPSVVVNEACMFGLSVMDAALADTHIDLIVLLGGFYLPQPHEWKQERKWIEDEFPEWVVSGMHSISRYATAMLLKRIKTSKADFLSFQKAAIALREIGVFEDGPGGKEDVRVNFFAQDLFPSLKIRSRDILARRPAFEWRSEGEGEAPVVSEELIAEARQAPNH